MRISELFLSIQGEGRLTGKPMFFIRAQGCAVKCPIREVCDQPESLSFKGGQEFSPEALAERALAEVGIDGWVCVTGGEPLEQRDFAAVVTACHVRKLHVNLQTSGLHAAPVRVDWCTVSPKAPATRLAMTNVDELKVIYTGQTEAELRDYYTAVRAANYYLQPCWRAGTSNQAETLATVFSLNRVGMRWEFSAQWHKFLGVH